MPAEPISTLPTPRAARTWREVLAVAGAAAMLAYAAWWLPPAASLRKLPETPLDNSRNREAAPWYRLLVEAAQRIPSSATVLVRGASRA